MSRMNFEVYKAANVPRTFLAVSTSAGLDAEPPESKHGFAAQPALPALVDELTAAFQASGGAAVPVTLMVHGYNTRRGQFERELIQDGRDSPAGPNASETFRPDERFLIGFRWPSEGVSSRESWRDTGKAVLLTPAIGVLLLLLPLHGLLLDGGLERLLKPVSPLLARAALGVAELAWRLEAPVLTWLGEHAPWLGGLVRAALAPFSGPTAGAIWLGAGAMLLLLRLSTYPRDRYRAIHYGVPDLGEFLKELESGLHQHRVRIRLDVIGHSMGTLLLINAFRVMSDFFHGRRESTAGALATPPLTSYNEIGRDGTFQLRSLILCAPDLPAAMATPDHNNYFLSALRRFETVHVFSSDRDLILKWLSSIANWMSEPRFDMAGRKLGNVHLVRARPASLGRPDSRAAWTIWPMTRPLLRAHHLYPHDPLGQAAPAFVHFHDCTTDVSVSGPYRSMLGASVVVSSLLWLLGRALDSALLQWLGGALGFTLLLGLVARPLWPRLRDHGLLGGVVGAIGESPTLMMFAMFWRAWNPHVGYFMFGQRPRQRICRVLRDPASFPPRGSAGIPLEEADGPIRYRLVRVSV